MNDVLKRSIWGAIFIVIMISCFIVGTLAASAVLGIFMLLAVLEYFKLFSHSKSYNPSQNIGVLGVIAFYVLWVERSLGSLSLDLNFVLIPLLFLPFLLIFSKRTKNHLSDIALTMFPWVYIGYTFSLMFSIYQKGSTLDFYWLYIVGFFVLVWTNDTLAYCAGRLFGRHKLCPSISPKKTWEGAIGGFVFTLLMGWIFALVFNGNIIFWILAGVVISPTAIVGDLIESRFKRWAEIKDSGTIIPGHGGILDRFDAAIFAAPFFYLLLLLFSNG